MKAKYHARREKSLRAYRSAFSSVIPSAVRLLQADKSQRQVEEIERFDKEHGNLYDDGSTCMHLEFSLDFPLTSSDPSEWDNLLRNDIAIARKTLSILEPRLAYHASLRQKYEYAMSHPWQSVPPTPQSRGDPIK